MSTYSLVKLPQESIIIFTPHAGPDMLAEGSTTIPEVIKLIEAQPDPVGLIIDLSNLKLDFSEIQSGTGIAALGPTAPFHHPHVRVIAIVSKDPIVKMANEGLSYDVYGNLLVFSAESLEQALAYVRAQL